MRSLGSLHLFWAHRVKEGGKLEMSLLKTSCISAAPSRLPILVAVTAIPVIGIVRELSLRGYFPIHHELPKVGIYLGREMLRIVRSQCLQICVRLFGNLLTETRRQHREIHEACFQPWLC